MNAIEQKQNVVTLPFSSHYNTWVHIGCLLLREDDAGHATAVVVVRGWTKLSSK